MGLRWTPLEQLSVAESREEETRAIFRSKTPFRLLNPSIVARLDDESGEWLSLKNIALLRVVGARHNALNEAPVLLLANDFGVALRAKIVLHAFGVVGGKIAVVTSLEGLQADPDTRLTLAGDFFPTELAALERLGKVSEELPSLPLPDAWVRWPEPENAQFAVLVLGNEPLDASTPTLEMVQRVLTAVEFLRQRPLGLLALTGGRTAGPISEAEMMALIAVSHGVPWGRIVLETESLTTKQNALFSAPLLEARGVKRVILVSTASHLERALPLFRATFPFATIEPLTSEVDHAAILRQMEHYVQHHHNPRVEHRLRKLYQQQQTAAAH